MGPDTDQRGPSWFSQPVLSLVLSDTMTASPAPAPGRTGRCSWSLEERTLGPAPDPARLTERIGLAPDSSDRQVGDSRAVGGISRQESTNPPTAWVPAGQGCQSREPHEDTDSSPGMGINVQCRVQGKQAGPCDHQAAGTRASYCRDWL